MLQPTTNQPPATSDASNAEVLNRIALATHGVVAKHGIPRVTFRAVAKEAKLSLGTVSYHFTDKTELMQAATRLSRERFYKRFKASLTEAQNGKDLAKSLSDLVELLTVKLRAQLYVDYELFLAAFYNDATREIALEWSQDVFDDLILLTDRDSALILAYYLEGLCLHAAKFGKPFSAQEVLPHISRILKS